MYGISIGDCAICQEPISSSSPSKSVKAGSSKQARSASALGCGHIFHMECAQQLTPPESGRHILCPVCRQPHKSKLVPLIASAAEYKLETPKSLTSLMEELSVTAGKITSLAKDAKGLGDGSTTCVYCDLCFEQWADFVKHFRSEHQRINCDMCSEWFESTVTYRNHYANVHEKHSCEHWQCRLQDSAPSFDSVQALVEHSRHAHPPDQDSAHPDAQSTRETTTATRPVNRRDITVPARARPSNAQTTSPVAQRSGARRTRSSPGTYGFANRHGGASAINDRHVYVENGDSEEFGIYEDEFDGDSQNAELLCEICCIYFRNKGEMDMHALGMHDVGDAADAWGEEDWRCSHPTCEDRGSFRSEKAFCQHFSAKHVSYL